MAERLRELPAKILEWWNKFTSRQKTVIIAIAATVVFAFVIMIFVLSQTKYILIQTLDNPSQTSQVVDILNGAGITNRVSSDGLRVEVDSTQESQARLALGAAGFSTNTPSLSDYLSSSMSTTASDKEKYYKEYMEDQLTQTLSALTNVKSVKVHLNIPEQNGTLASRNEEASAFIQLELDGTFTSANAANVARSVASFLHNDTTANITIMDYDANILFAGGDDYSTAGIASSMQELQNQAESMISNQVRRVLYGTNQYSMIEVSSHLNMDYSNYEEAVKEYYANAERDEGMIAHQDSFNSENVSDIGGTPGTDSNDGSTYVWDTTGGTTSNQTELSTDYLPNESLVTKITPAGAINYATSSVSVAAISYREVHEEDVKRQGLLDGDTTWEDYKAQNGADRRLTVEPEFYEMVANATGISADRITIIAYETPIFYDQEGLKVNWSTVLSIVMLIVILGLLALVVIRSMTARTEVSGEEELSVEELLQSSPESELEDIDVETKSDTRRMIEKFVDENPEAAAALLRNWLNEDWG